MHYTDEQIASQGLNVAAYAGKWKTAQTMALQAQSYPDHRVLPYWERVRKLYLELGGDYTKEQ